MSHIFSHQHLLTFEGEASEGEPFGNCWSRQLEFIGVGVGSFTFNQFDLQDHKNVGELGGARRGQSTWNAEVFGSDLVGHGCTMQETKSLH